MNLANLKPQTQLLLTILVPVFCLLLAALPVIPHVSHLKKVNKQLEDILVRNKDMESLLQHLNTRYSIAYVVNLRADTQRPVVVPGYVQKMLDKHGGSFHEMLLDYCDKLVAPAYRDGFRMLFDYDYVRDRICREGAIRYAYVRNDGERFLITIFPDTHSVDEVMWVFAKEDTSSEE